MHACKNVSVLGPFVPVYGIQLESKLWAAGGGRCLIQSNKGRSGIGKELLSVSSCDDDDNDDNDDDDDDGIEPIDRCSRPTLTSMPMDRQKAI